jgi:hypothetical protein
VNADYIPANHKIWMKQQPEQELWCLQLLGKLLVYPLLVHADYIPANINYDATTIRTVL